jgi:hypothetical protein
VDLVDLEEAALDGVDPAALADAALVVARVALALRAKAAIKVRRAAAELN